MLKNVKVGKWPYQVAIDYKNNKLFVSNQRSNSISIIDAENFTVVKELKELCEYPEGININYKNNFIVVACWFDDEVAIINLLDYSLIKKVSVSGGPRSFGNFILNN